MSSGESPRKQDKILKQHMNPSRFEKGILRASMNIDVMNGHFIVAQLRLLPRLD